MFQTTILIWWRSLLLGIVPFRMIKTLWSPNGWLMGYGRGLYHKKIPHILSPFSPNRCHQGVFYDTVTLSVVNTRLFSTVTLIFGKILVKRLCVVNQFLRGLTIPRQLRGISAPAQPNRNRNPQESQRNLGVKSSNLGDLYHVNYIIEIRFFCVLPTHVDHVGYIILCSIASIILGVMRVPLGMQLESPP